MKRLMPVFKVAASTAAVLASALVISAAISSASLAAGNAGPGDQGGPQGGGASGGCQGNCGGGNSSNGGGDHNGPEGCESTPNMLAGWDGCGRRITIDTKRPKGPVVTKTEIPPPPAKPKGPCGDGPVYERFISGVKVNSCSPPPIVPAVARPRPPAAPPVAHTPPPPAAPVSGGNCTWERGQVVRLTRELEQCRGDAVRAAVSLGCTSFEVLPDGHVRFNGCRGGAPVPRPQ